MSATLVRPACPLCGFGLIFEGTGLAGCDGGCDPDRIRSELGWPAPAPAAATNGHEPGAKPAAEPPRLAELLDELAGFIRRFVVMNPAQIDATALWVAHSHTFEAAAQTPYISITSAEKRSGKTRLLEVFELLVARPWLTGRATAAVLARKVDAERPTLLLDESDAAFKGEKEYAEALRGLLNTGHRRGGKSTVCVGQGTEIGYKDFSTFCAKAIAGIGKLPDTVADRSLPIRLERRAPGEQAERSADGTRKVTPVCSASSLSGSQSWSRASKRRIPTSRRRLTIGPRMRLSRCSPSQTSPVATGPPVRGQR